MKGLWIHKGDGEIAVVFVHGILSSGDTCWLSENGTYWPRLLAAETDLPNLGVYVFTYRSDIFSGNYRLGDAVDSLKEHLRLDDVARSRRLVFVAHSMGGILVRDLLVVREMDFIDQGTMLGLFLIASPSLGSSYANWLKVLARSVGNTQADALRFGQQNAWLNDLDKNFLNLKESGRLSIRGKELVEDNFVVFRRLWRRQVVEPFSGFRYFGEPFKVPHSNHFSIAKPEGSDAIQHRLLCQFIKETTSSPAPAQAGRAARESDNEREVLFRLGAIVRLLDNARDAIPNEKVIRLEHLLEGSYTGGQRAFEGTSTIALVQHLRLHDGRWSFLEESEGDLAHISEITDARAGERAAGVIQSLDYEGLGMIRDRLRGVLARLSSRSSGQSGGTDSASKTVFESVKRFSEAATLDQVFQAFVLRRTVTIRRPDAELALHEELVNVTQDPQFELVRVIVSDTPIEFADMEARARLTIGADTFDAAISAVHTSDNRTFRVTIGFKGRAVKPQGTLAIDFWCRCPGAVPLNEDYWIFPCLHERPVGKLVSEVVFPCELADFAFYRVGSDGLQHPVEMRQVANRGGVDGQFGYIATCLDTTDMHVMTWRVRGW